MEEESSAPCLLSPKAPAPIPTQNENSKEKDIKRGDNSFKPCANPTKRYRTFITNIPVDVKWQSLNNLVKDKLGERKVLEHLRPGCEREPLSDRNSVALSPNKTQNSLGQLELAYTLWLTKISGRPGQIQAQTQLCTSLQKRQMINQKLMIMKRMSQWAASSVMLPNWLTVDRGLRGRHSFTVFLDFQMHYPEKSAKSPSEATKVEKMPWDGMKEQLDSYVPLMSSTYNTGSKNGMFCFTRSGAKMRCVTSPARQTYQQLWTISDPHSAIRVGVETPPLITTRTTGCLGYSSPSEAFRYLLPFHILPELLSQTTAEYCSPTANARGSHYNVMLVETFLAFHEALDRNEHQSLLQYLEPAVDHYLVPPRFLVNRAHSTRTN
ncbi:hypothetical protein ACRRTK_013610 [Alexandromys fortis]